VNPQETVGLLRLVASGWPSMKISEYTADVWHPALEDIPFTDAAAAVTRLIRTSSAYIAPADIRREAYRDAGMLAPIEDRAWDNITRVATAQGEGRSLLHPVEREAYEALGGSQGIRNAKAEVLRAQFAKTWRRLADDYERELMLQPYVPLKAIAS
jgi:hypothetical protein